MAVCVPNEVVIDGASVETNGTVVQYQRSRQFRLHAVLYSVCGIESLLVKTVAKWSATGAAAGARTAAAVGGAKVEFPTTTMELVVPSSTLFYGIHDIDISVVSNY